MAGWETASSIPLRSVIAPRSAGTTTCASCWVAAALRSASARTTPSQPARTAASARRPRKTAKRRPIRRSISRTRSALRRGGGRGHGPARGWCGGSRRRRDRGGGRGGGGGRRRGRGRARRGGGRRGGGGRGRGGGGRRGRRGGHQRARHDAVVGQQRARGVAGRAHPLRRERGVGRAGTHAQVVDVARGRGHQPPLLGGRANPLARSEASDV